MDILGIHTGFLLIQLPFLSFFVAWLILGLISLYLLHNVQTTRINTLLWGLFVLLIPLSGAIAFLIIRPDREIHE